MALPWDARGFIWENERPDRHLTRQARRSSLTLEPKPNLGDAYENDSLLSSEIGVLRWLDPVVCRHVRPGGFARDRIHSCREHQSRCDRARSGWPPAYHARSSQQLQTRHLEAGGGGTLGRT